MEDLDIQNPNLTKEELQQLLQLRAIYELTTSISKKCFETCIPRINARMEDSEKNCISNCAANFLHMKLFLTKRLINAAQLNQITD